MLKSIMDSTYLGLGSTRAKESKVAFDGIQEVYSIMRNDDSSDEDYLDYFYDTRSERTTNYQREQGSAHQSTTRSESKPE